MTDSEKLDLLLRQQAEIKDAVKVLADQALRAEANFTVIAVSLGEMEKDTAIQAKALVAMSRDLQDLRDHVIEGEDRMGRRMKLVEESANGHG